MRDTGMLGSKTVTAGPRAGAAGSVGGAGAAGAAGAVGAAAAAWALGATRPPSASVATAARASTGVRDRLRRLGKGWWGTGHLFVEGLVTRVTTVQGGRGVELCQGRVHASAALSAAGEGPPNFRPLARKPQASRPTQHGTFGH